MKRAARLADGWFQPLLRPGAPEAEAKRDRLYQYLREVGRDPENFGIEGWVNYGSSDPRQWRDQVVAWQTWGATHVSVRTFDCGLPTPQTHIDAIRDYKEGLKREGVDV
jgi:hypothetical protein